MAMKPQCVQAVNAAAGRELRPSELQAIENRISGTMRRLAQADPQAWAGKSMADRVMEAATAAMRDLQAEAARKVANVQRQALATAATQGRIADLKTNLGSGQSRALVEDLNNTHLYADGVKRESVSRLVDLIEAANSKQGAGVGRRALMFLFDAQNPQMTQDLVTEIFANGKGSTGNQVAQTGARAWLDVIESLRQRFNAAGGDVGKLAYGYLPQPHDTARVRAAGRDGWVAKTLPLLDRARYVREDGSRMSDAEVVDFLRASHETIATDGLSKTAPGQMRGSGAKANKGSDSRQIHFKDGQAYAAYLSEFGRGSMYDAMVGHVGVMARDIALVERYGPNPEAQFRLQNDLAERADQGIKRSFGNKPQAYWDLMTGKAGAPESARLAQVGQDIRNIQTFGKLAGALLSSITDVGTLMVTAGYNRLGYWQTLKNVGKQASPEVRQFLTSHGLIAESLLSDLNRWAGENIANNWSGRLANSTMRLSLMNVWTDSLRRGFSMTMMQGLAKLSQTKWADLTEWDRSHLGRKGITEADWDVVTRAQLTDFQGAKFLTPEAIQAADIAQARPQDLQRIRDDIQAQTADLAARNAQDQEWIKGRIDKFDAARDALNRAVKQRAEGRKAKNEKATGPLLERMALLDAQREAAQMQADIESEYNKLFTKADIDAFNAGLRQASSDLVAADKKAISAAERSGRQFGERKQRIEQKQRELQNRAAKAKDAEKALVAMAIKEAELDRAALQNEIEIAFKATPDAERAAFRQAVEGVKEVARSARAGISAAELIGRRYGEAKGRLERRMLEIENRITEMDRQADRATNADAKEAAKKAEEMLAELREFTERSQERQQRRMAVIDRLNAQEAPRLAAEAQRIKNEVTAKILGFITDESEYAVINPDLATRAIQTGGALQAGTVPGELARLTMQFKSFPIAMISRHWRRMLEGDRGLDGAPMSANKLAYGAALFLTTTALGAIAFQTKQMVQGKDPVDMTTPKFWARAAAQGGGAGFLGDIVLGDTTGDRSPLDSLSRLLMGPTFGSAADLWELTKGNIDELRAGKDTHAGAEALRFSRSHLPYINLWYARTALDHMLLHGIQENLSPGYLQRQQARHSKEWGGSYWWEPGADFEDMRAPDMGAAVGN